MYDKIWAHNVVKVYGARHARVHNAMIKILGIDERFLGVILAKEQESSKYQLNLWDGWKFLVKWTEKVESKLITEQMLRECLREIVENYFFWPESLLTARKYWRTLILRSYDGGEGDRRKGDQNDFTRIQTSSQGLFSPSQKG